MLREINAFCRELRSGTCWLAATSFDRNAAEMHTYLSDGEIIAAISPIGEKANKLTANELTLRMKYDSDNRMDFNTLFTDISTNGRIQDERTKRILQMVRLAPSALNNQPWRVVMDGDIAHFYVVRCSIVLLDYDYQMMDMGAALFHYAAASGRNTFYFLNPELNIEYEYVVSVR